MASSTPDDSKRPAKRQRVLGPDILCCDDDMDLSSDSEMEPTFELALPFSQVSSNSELDHSPQFVSNVSVCSTEECVTNRPPAKWVLQPLTVDNVQRSHYFTNDMPVGPKSEQSHSLHIPDDLELTSASACSNTDVTTIFSTRSTHDNLHALPKTFSEPKCKQIPLVEWTLRPVDIDRDSIDTPRPRGTIKPNFTESEQSDITKYCCRLIPLTDTRIKLKFYDRHEIKHYQQISQYTERITISLLNKFGQTNLSGGARSDQWPYLGLCIMNRLLGGSERFKFVVVPTLRFISDQEEIADVQQFMKCVIECPCVKICYNCKDVMLVLMKDFGIVKSNVVKCDWFDVKIACWMLNSDKPPADFMAACRLIIGDGNLQHRSYSNDLARELKVSGEDVMKLDKLMCLLTQKLARNNLSDVFKYIEMCLVPQMACMEMSGITISVSYLNHIRQNLSQAVAEISEWCCKIVGHKIILDSPHQVAHVLFDIFHLDKQLGGFKPPLTGRNKISTSEVVLHQLSDKHPLPTLILQYRQFTKLLAYVVGLLNSVEERSKTIHPSWEQSNASTGRLSCSSPNMQSIPKMDSSDEYLLESPIFRALMVDGHNVDEVQFQHKLEKCRINGRIRNGFISRDGYEFVAADFQHIEFRLLAELTHDTQLLQLFRSSEEDLFAGLASQIYRCEVADVTKQQRESAKTMVYAVMYGVGQDRLAHYMKMADRDAQVLIQQFHEQYPCVKRLKSSSVKELLDNGFVLTLYGRKRIPPNFNSLDKATQAQARRQAVNFKIQGTAADICKMLIIKVEQLIGEEDLHAWLKLQIHDEILYEVRRSEVSRFIRILKRVSEQKLWRDVMPAVKHEFSIPLPVRISVGSIWGKLTPV